MPKYNEPKTILILDTCRGTCLKAYKRFKSAKKYICIVEALAYVDPVDGQRVETYSEEEESQGKGEVVVHVQRTFSHFLNQEDLTVVQERS